MDSTKIMCLRCNSLVQQTGIKKHRQSMKCNSIKQEKYCYVCMIDGKKLVNTCGQKNHRVCIPCRKQLTKCPMCRVPIVSKQNNQAQVQVQFQDESFEYDDEIEQVEEMLRQAQWDVDSDYEEEERKVPEIGWSEGRRVGNWDGINLEEEIIIQTEVHLNYSYGQFGHIQSVLVSDLLQCSYSYFSEDVGLSSQQHRNLEQFLAFDFIDNALQRAEPQHCDKVIELVKRYFAVDLTSEQYHRAYNSHLDLIQQIE